MTPSNSKSRVWMFFGLVSMIAVIIVAAIGSGHVFQPKITQSDIRKATLAGDHASALRMLSILLNDRGDQGTLLLKAGEAATHLGKFDEAIAYYQRVPNSEPREAATARWASGEIELHRRRMTKAIAWFEESLQLDPNRDDARVRLIYLLNLAGRRWEAIPHLFAMVREKQISVQQLIYLGNASKSIENEKELQQFLDGEPRDAMPKLGLARIRIRQGLFDEARRSLEEVINQQPELIEAYIQLGKIAVNEPDSSLLKWHSRLPKGSENHPDLWMIRGEWARHEEDWLGAVRSFAEVLRLDPNHLSALHSLGQTLHRIDRAAEAKDCFDRAHRIEKFHATLERLMAEEFAAQATMQGFANAMPTSNPQSRLESMARAAQETYELDRFWESEAWSLMGLSLDPNRPDLQELVQLSRKRLLRNSPLVSERVLASSLDSWRAYPLPKWIASSEIPQSVPHALENGTLANVVSEGTSPSGKSVRFEKVSKGLGFSYFASRKEPMDGRRMFEFTGGGIGVLDYDSDGWPDLYLAQGCRWPADGTDRDHRDRLMRNVWNEGSNSFIDVTAEAGIDEGEFGQGVAIGDLNSDGFEDIYVCNIGKNRLWLNQGDGTFRDGSSLFENMPENWTVSAAIFDLNGDGSAEIYDANYVEGRDVYTRRCLVRGLPRACSPLNFEKSKGVLWSCLPEGVIRNLERVPFEATLQDGNALGLSLFRVLGDSKLSLFVANDQVANLLLKPVVDPSDFGWRWEDQALPLGLAYDGEGKAQACMGIATGDVDCDGRIDLFVTNYYDESNTLYLQQERGLFRDATKEAGLVGPSLKMLGFGTQFIDADLDGNLDLVVLNGHVDDMTHMGIPFRMRAQFFTGNGHGQFHERLEDIGRFFKEERVGRALAWLDFDRDGKQDLVAGDLVGETELLRNESRSGNYLNLRLIGTTSHRDAIGAQVTIRTPEKTWTHQVTAGHGYLVTNSKSIHQGLGELLRVDQIEIEWLSGHRQVFRDVRANAEWIAIEGDDVLHESVRASE